MLFFIADSLLKGLLIFLILCFAVLPTSFIRTVYIHLIRLIWLLSAVMTVASGICFYAMKRFYEVTGHRDMPKGIDLSFVLIYTIESLTEPEPKRFLPKRTVGTLIRE